MIGKITTGRAPGGVIAYVLGPGEKGVEDRAQILATTWTGSPEGWASQVHEHQQSERPGFGDAGAASVVHISLNAAPGERLSDDAWRAVAEEYLARMGWSEHDHAVIRHTDTTHDHVHIVLDRVGRDGQIADLHKEYERQERVLDSIERDFGLARTHEQLRLEAERDPFRAVESVTRNNLTFGREQMDRYFERLGFDAAKIRELTDLAMTDHRVLFTDTSGVADKFTTREVVDEVQRLDSALRQLASQEARPTLDRGEGAREGLNPGQRAAAERIAEGGGLTVIEGFAGTGKSTLLRAAAEDLRFSGHEVLGVAPSGKAAKGLQESAHIESNTLTRTLMDIERGDTKLTASSVVVVDEAGMARNDDLGKLAQRVADAGGRLVLVGDERQLGAVGRGGGFSEAREIASGGTARLDEIHRQREQWQKEASKDFGEGHAGRAIQSYIDHSKVEWAASRGTARDMLVGEYVRELERGTKAENMLALAHENRDVRAMNAEIRDAIKERGGLQDERTYRLENADGKTQKLGVASGDRVVFERNTRDVDGREVKNGEFGTVSKVDSRGFSVRMDDGSSRRVEDGARQQMSHGYASSIHKSQGATVDKTHVLASRGMDSKLTYVSMSRQREDTKLYANTTEFKDAGHLKNSLSRDCGREAFRAVANAGTGKEKAQTRAQDQDHGPRGAAGGEGQRKEPERDVERERQPVVSYIAEAAMDQKKMETGLLPKGQARESQGQAGKDEAPRAKSAQQERQGEAQAQTKDQDQPTRENQAWQEAQPAREGERREQGQDKQLREKSWGAGDSSAGRVQQQNTGQEKVLGKDQRQTQGKSESKSKQKHGPQVQAGKDKKSKGYGL